MWREFDTVMRRTAIVLLGAMGFSLLLVYLLFVNQRNASLHDQQTNHLAEILASAVHVVEASPPASRKDLVRQLKFSRTHLEIGDGPIVAHHDQTDEEGDLSDQLKIDLVNHDVRVVKITNPENVPEDASNRLLSGKTLLSSTDYRHIPTREAHSIYWMSIQMADGTWLNGFIPIRPPGSFFQHTHVISQILLSMVLLALTAMWAVSWLSKPIKHLSEAAERLGRDIASPGAQETGPKEFRQAAHSFNVMRDRICRLVEDRTQMLAAISHDLRTPITRLRLRMEFVEESPERVRMLEDLDEMERMISATMIFARDTVPNEDRQSVDIASLVQGAAADFSDMGADITYNGPESLNIKIHALAMKRAVVNLIDNAQKYGGSVTVVLSKTAEDIELVIDDAGPGIPPEYRELVFSPFVRLEKSRNRDTGGNGLGLSIARAAIRAHGGDIVLGDSPTQGLRVTVTLPI